MELVHVSAKGNGLRGLYHHYKNIIDIVRFLMTEINVNLMCNVRKQKRNQQQKK